MRSRTHAHVDAPQRDRWLVSYADLVTLLFAVFVVLFAFSWHSKQRMTTVSNAIHTGFDALSADPPVVSPPPNSSNVLLDPVDPTDGSMVGTPPPHYNTAELSKQLEGVLGDSISKKEIVMQQTQDGLIISLRELGFFNSGASNLLPGAEEKLQGTAKILMDHGLELRVEGHSDDQPIHNAMFQSNWELSTARAMSVLLLLVDHAGFPPEKISVAGYGPYRPVADNSTPEGRRTNRRVDLVVITPKSKSDRAE